LTKSLSTAPARKARSQPDTIEWAASLAIVTLASVSEGSSRRWVRVAVNLLSAAAISGLALRAGVRLEEQGLARQSIGRGLRSGAIVSVPVALAMIAGARSRSLRGLYRPVASSPARFNDVVVESLLRIPLVTALPEELMFRGGLLGLASRGQSRSRAAAQVSLAFGLFHVAPTLRRIRAGNVLWREDRIPVLVRVLSNVTATALAGLPLAALRYRSGSILAPWLVHSTANASGMLASWFVSRNVKNEVWDASQPPGRR
jgi:membrane protease YdiL (CAAX protease family)